MSMRLFHSSPIPHPVVTKADPTQRKYETLGLILLATGLLGLVDLFFAPGGNHILRMLTGRGAILAASILLALGIFFTFRRLIPRFQDKHWYPEALLGIQLLLISCLMILHLPLGPDSYMQSLNGTGGGLIGWALAESLHLSLGRLLAWVLSLIGFGLGAVLVYYYTPLRLISLPPYRITFKAVSKEKRPGNVADRSPNRYKVKSEVKKAAPQVKVVESEPSREKVVTSQSPAAPKTSSTPRPKPKSQPATARQATPRRSKKLPPLSLLTGEDHGGATVEAARIRAQIIEDTLASFNIPAEVVSINVGPTVTQFGVRPGAYQRGGRRVRVRVSKITGLQDDLALALAASPVRIEAPVPGERYIGIEVPNSEATLVSLRQLLLDKSYRQVRGPLALPVGRDVSGGAIGIDLRLLPHLLIAGATGSGKSVALNAMICALLFNNMPSNLRLVLIDPKRVELPVYNGIPHLVSPVITDPKHAEGALMWLLVEMDERYRLFNKEKVRHLEAYNRAVSASQRLPYIVMVIDELADMIVTAPESIETSLVRLAQMSRATGIHLIIATQRPSVDIVTGLIKANFPARLAFAVTSQTDSRVILDAPGADKLLGRGDGLLMTPDTPQLRRIQGCFVSDSEINSLVKWWKERQPDAERDPSQPRYPWSSMLVEQATENDMLQQAIESLKGRETINTSGLQRLLSVGYQRAAHLMTELEKAGIVGPELDKRQGRPVLIEEDDLSFD